jgi:hypothetical protein
VRPRQCRRRTDPATWEGKHEWDVYDTTGPLLHYFSTPHHYIAVVVYHNSTHISFLFASILFPAISSRKTIWVVSLGSTRWNCRTFLEMVKGKEGS